MQEMLLEILLWAVIHQTHSETVRLYHGKGFLMSYVINRELSGAKKLTSPGFVGQKPFELPQTSSCILLCTAYPGIHRVLCEESMQKLLLK